MSTHTCNTATTQKKKETIFKLQGLVFYDHCIVASPAHYPGSGPVLLILFSGGVHSISCPPTQVLANPITSGVFSLLYNVSLCRYL